MMEKSSSLFLQSFHHKCLTRSYTVLCEMLGLLYRHVVITLCIITKFAMNSYTQPATIFSQDTSQQKGFDALERRCPICEITLYILKVFHESVTPCRKFFISSYAHQIQLRRFDFKRTYSFKSKYYQYYQMLNLD